ncbi:hypothetical protein HYPSUDRAFT_204233 [Hypholoma sublateritium FD-334 SS-4]|uniref:Uncharacterized protein n=1 Tax=Hypholoma sublateritium (strain FD-334 SS-4) TaxID=945553 RepID=A0A0D2NTA1_HYPSF|nr:hypothetical protein HYPSUDRAFT_204233 [Hypholoma sublateritium FD-334 SS-4]
MYPLTDYSTGKLTDTILLWCMDIFLLANFQSLVPPPPAVRRLSPSLSPTLLNSPPSSLLPPIPAAQLRSMLFEEIMSTSFEVMVNPSGNFMGNGMVDALSEYGVFHGEVLVTVEMGPNLDESMALPKLPLLPLPYAAS